MTFFLSSVTSLMPVFITLTLAVVRSINILLPMYSINRRIMYSTMITYQILWLPLIVLECHSIYAYFSTDFERRLYFLIISRMVGSETIAIIEPDIHSTLVYLVIAIGLPFVLPSVLCVVCGMIQCYTLVKRAPAVGTRSYLRNRRITVTVAQLTTVFTVCSTVGFVVMFTFSLTVPDIAQTTQWELYLTFITCTMGPYFNSLINPIILITRGKTLRTFSRESYYLPQRGSSRGSSRGGGKEGIQTSKLYIINSLCTNIPLQELHGQDIEQSNECGAIDRVWN